MQLIYGVIIAIKQQYNKKYQQKNYYNKGFSLLETSIVIIIISLLITTLVQGVEFIDQAKLYKIYKNIELQKKSVNSFKQIYNYYPGDLPNACSANNDSESLLNYNCASNFTIFPTTCGTKGIDNCNGDGKIKGEESFRALKDLAQAGFLKESYSGISGSAYISDNNANDKNIISSFYHDKAGYTAMVTSDEAHLSEHQQANFNNRIITILGIESNQSNKLPTFPILTPLHAMQLDNKYDDGKPWSGDIRVYTTNSADQSNPSQQDCVTGNSATYNIDNLNVVCTMIFALDNPHEF